MTGTDTTKFIQCETQLRPQINLKVVVQYL